MARQIFFSGIQPTGKIHLGNYLGAIKNWVKLQNDNPDALHIYCIVDYHALTDKYKIDHNLKFDTNIKEDSIHMAATLLSSGLDPKKSIIFLQSQVPQHTELQWILSCLAPQNWLNKMTQFKDKKTPTSNLALFTYPILMASDIILYKTTKVPVGEDQKQHVELCRDYINRLNSLFIDQIYQLPQPDYHKSEFPRVMSLRDASKKMSKSDPSDYSRINLTDNEQQITEKINKAKTDSIPNIYYDPEQRPEISNLIKLFSSVGDTTHEEAINTVKNMNTVQFKKILSETIIQKTIPIAQNTERFMNDKEQVYRILMDGNKKAEQIAQKTLNEIKSNLGILIF